MDMVFPVGTSTLHELVTYNCPGCLAFEVLFYRIYSVCLTMRQALEGQAHDLYNSIVDLRPLSA